MNGSLKDRIVFYIRYKLIKKAISKIRIVYLGFLGADISFTANISKCSMTWPHQIRIGQKVTVEEAVAFKFDGIWKSGPSIIIDDFVFIGRGVEFNVKQSLQIGSYSLIGAGTRFIDHDHGIALGVPISKQACPTLPISIGKDVWIGANVVVLKGVTINEGAVVAAGSIVNKEIPAYEIWGGVPAKFLKKRI